MVHGHCSGRGIFVSLYSSRVSACGSVKNIWVHTDNAHTHAHTPTLTALRVTYTCGQRYVKTVIFYKDAFLVEFKGQSKLGKHDIRWMRRIR